ncbi:MAG: helix-turn-helix transcriptional regulator [Epsilonproteobacteria bacterium]|nr:helix-turn-helix transcriptional regulator [Campylobacterota bacterium]
MSNIIKEITKELGLTQKQLAEHIGVKEDTVSQWARGINPVPKWALKMFDLLKKEQKYQSLEADLDKMASIVSDLKSVYGDKNNQ